MRYDPRPTIIILSANAGYGHAKAGGSLQRALNTAMPEYNIIHENICDYTAISQKWSIERCWQILSVTPGLRHAYSFGHRLILSNEHLTWAASHLFRSAAKAISRRHANTNIHAVIALHPGAAVAAGYWRRERHFYLAVVATDLVVHGFHLLKEADHIFCDRRAYIVCRKGVLSQFRAKIVYSGLPIEMEFYHRVSNLTYSDVPYVLVTFGAKGLRAKQNVRNILEAILKIPDVRIVFICGENRKLQEQIHEAALGYGMLERVAIYGFVENMAELMQAASIVVGKPGGITVGEVIAANKPMVIVDHLPGQEKYNVNALVASGLGFPASKRKLKQTLCDLLKLDRLPIPLSFRDTECAGIAAITSFIVKKLNEDAQDYRYLELPKPRYWPMRVL